MKHQSKRLQKSWLGHSDQTTGDPSQKTEKQDMMNIDKYIVGIVDFPMACNFEFVINLSVV